MKVAITGHTSGIGKALAEHFSDHSVSGFSRSNGYDISIKGVIEKIAEETKDHDLFLNCAYSEEDGSAQMMLLYAIVHRWRRLPERSIISIGSTSADGITPYRDPYGPHKVALDKATEQLQRTSACRVMALRLGFTDTPMSADYSPKIDLNTVIDAVSWMLSKPANILISSTTILPRNDLGFPFRYRGGTKDDINDYEPRS